MDYITHLNKDKKFRPVLESQDPILLKSRKNVCLRLCASIMSQQLSTKVAEVLFRRFLELYGGEEPTPAQIAATPPETLRGIGLSNAKAGYIGNVARFMMAHDLTDEHLKKLGNDELIALLTQIKGVGQWTVEMLLMFTLGREDVFAVDDYGIQMAMKKLYNLESTDKKEFKKAMLRLSQKWKPYRTYACMHLWRWKDAPAV